MFSYSMPSRRPTTKLCLAALLAALLAAGSVALPAHGQSAGGGAAAKPNFLVVVTDDQTLEQMRAMPKTERFIGRKGTTFSEAVVTTPHCCPSRASMLTGQYAHNHGILSNKHGYPAFVDPGNVLPVWLQRAGYTTAHLGKFLNGYEKAVGPITTVAPGWDEWATLLKPRRFLDYDLQVNGETVSYGDQKKDFLTTVLTDRAGKLIRDLGAPGRPVLHPARPLRAPLRGGRPERRMRQVHRRRGLRISPLRGQAAAGARVVQREEREGQADLHPAPRPPREGHETADARRLPVRAGLAGERRRRRQGALLGARGGRRARGHGRRCSSPTTGTSTASTGSRARRRCPTRRRSTSPS